MKLIIGSDKSGFTLKEFVRTYLDEQSIEYEDIGTKNIEIPVPFFEVAPIAAKKMQKEPGSKALLFCGTGMGMAQVATKFKGILAACCESTYSARMCRAVNNSNVLCIGGWIVAPEMGLEMVKIFLNTDHTEGLEEWRRDFLKKAIMAVEQTDEENRKGN